MKAIQLHTAAVDNGGTRRDAPAVLTIGDGAEHIDAKRAKALVDNGGAVDASPVEKSPVKGAGGDK
jgi:hypothetical protein